MSNIVDTESAEPFILKVGTPYQICSSDRRYVQATGVMQPLKLVSSPSKITIWEAVDFGTTGRITLRAPSGWYASAPEYSTDGPLIEDPNTGTQWDPTVVTSQFLTLNNRAQLFWTTRPGSDEVWLRAKDGSSGTQAWRFIEVTKLDDEE